MYAMPKHLQPQTRPQTQCPPRQPAHLEPGTHCPSGEPDPGTARGELACYDVPRSCPLLLDGHRCWTEPLHVVASDHTGQRPPEELPKPGLEPDSDPLNRCPLYLARQYARVLNATPAFVHAADPLPGAFGWPLANLLTGFQRDRYQDQLESKDLWGADHAGVNAGMPAHWVPHLLRDRTPVPPGLPAGGHFLFVCAALPPCSGKHLCA